MICQQPLLANATKLNPTLHIQLINALWRIAPIMAQEIR